MELNDLKHYWEEANAQTQKNETINRNVIDNITKRKYTSKMNTIAYPEMMGTCISFLGAVYLVRHFYKLNTPFLQVLGVMVLLYLVVAPTISLILLFRFKKMIAIHTPFIQTLQQFSIQKMRFYNFQKWNALFSYVLLAIFVIVLPPLFGKKGMHLNIYFWSATIFFGYIFLYFFSTWVLKSYNKSLQQSEELLKALAVE